VADVWRYADAAVVGSAIVNVIEKTGNSAEVLRQVADFAAGLIFVD
jgi:tryptophan synthase alpha subunit